LQVASNQQAALGIKQAAPLFFDLNDSKELNFPCAEPHVFFLCRQKITVGNGIFSIWKYRKYH
jgi:hypothetical protein